MTAAYHDDLTMPGACTSMWSQVLMLTVSDATIGVAKGSASLPQRRREIAEARDYLTIPNRDFNEVCHLAGLDPVAIRERAIRLIANAPSIESLADNPIVPGRHHRAQPQHEATV